MSEYSVLKARMVQWIGIIVIILFFAGAYWYFQARGSTFNQSGNESLTSGLLGLWSFNGDDISGTTATDRSGNGFNGTLTNGPTVAVGQVGQGINFDGSNDYVSIADNASLDFNDSDDFTLTGWFYRDTFTTDDTIIAKRNGITAGDAGYILYIDDATDQLILEVSDGTDEYDTTSRATFTGTGWHHFAATWDPASATNIELYIDGVDNNASDSGSAFQLAAVGDLSNALVLALGAESDAGSPFDGRLDDIRLYSRVLAATEITSIFDQGNPDKFNASASQTGGSGRLDSGVGLYLPLDEGTGTSAADSSTNGNTGTLNNGPTWSAPPGGTSVIGYAVDLDGTNDMINVPNDNSLNATDTADLTLAGWFYRDTFTTDDTIIAKRNGITATDIGYILYVDDATDQLILEVSDGTDEYSLTSSSTFTSTGWHHFAVVWDENSAAGSEMYINGSDDNATDSGTIGNIGDITVTSPLRVGSESDSATDNPFDGKVDEIRLYRRALSSEEIAMLSRLSAPTGIDTGLKGYWSLDGRDVSATEAFDLSGSSNTGTFTGGPAKIQGRVGQGMDLDGTDDYVSIPDVAVLDFADGVDMTLTGWFWRDTSNTDDVMIAKRNSNAAGQQGYILGLLASDDKLSFEVSDGTNEYQVSSTTTFTSTGWNHFAVVWDEDSASGTEIYINGLADNATDTGTIGSVAGLSNVRVLALGAESDAGNPFDGKLDEIRIYKRTLSAVEIKSFYDQGNPDRFNASASQLQGTGRAESGVAGYWPLDENTGTNAGDTSTNGNSGTLTNSPGWTTGNIGYAVDFDGSDDYISIADNDTLDVADSRNFTLSGWFNRDTFTTDDTILAKRNGITSGDTGYIVYIDDATDQLVFEVSDGSEEYQLTSSSVTFTATGWNHFAVVWDDAGAGLTRVFINGVAQPLTAVGIFSTINSLSNSVALALGAESDAGNPFDGKLDEIRIYNRAMTDEGIARLYRLSAPTGIETGLKGYWSFNGQDTVGSTTFDRSGGNNVGTLTNTPTKSTGKIGQGINFDGSDDYVSVADVTSLDTGDTADLVLTGWFNRDTFTTDDTILAKRNGITAGDTGYIAYVDDSTDKLTFEVSDGTDEYQLESTATFTSTGWNHFVIVWDQDSAANSEIYINGAANSATDTGTIGNIGDLSNALVLALGAESDAGNPFDGKLDEIRIYNRTLSAAEIAALYNSSR